MLSALSIRDVVLIERLDLAFEPGLNVLTGETGAGKSILLDSLGLALGARADSGLVRQGASQLGVTARFDISAAHPAYALLREQEFDLAEDEGLVLRRIVTQDGRSRAFINDQPVSVTLLRRLGDTLVEIHGQFETQGLLDAATHRSLLDDAGVSSALRETVARTWLSWQTAARRRGEAEAQLAQAQREEDFLRHVADELDALAPKHGEEEELAEKRTRLMHGEKLTGEISSALDALMRKNDVSSILRGALRSLERIADKTAGTLDAPAAALDRAAIEIEEATSHLERLLSDLDLDPRHLEQTEERLFALRAMARKHGMSVDELPAFHETTRSRLTALDSGGGDLAKLTGEEQAARDAYRNAALALSEARRKAAKALDSAVRKELAPLKLDKAQFETRITPLDENEWNAQGMDRVAFLVATNPGAPFGPLGKIASGGELSRFTLALKVVLAQTEQNHSLIFDEVDSGIGGAVADAVGERLARLAAQRQILVVTHSPQVAARGRHHWHVAKRQTASDTVITEVRPLSAPERQEEIARMLSGAHITEEARAAAARLLAGGAGSS